MTRLKSPREILNSRKTAQHAKFILQESVSMLKYTDSFYSFLLSYRLLLLSFRLLLFSFHPNTQLKNFCPRSLNIYITGNKQLSGTNKLTV